MSSRGPMDNRPEPRSMVCCRSCPAPPRTPAWKPAVDYLRGVDIVSAIASLPNNAKKFGGCRAVCSFIGSFMCGASVW